MIAIVMHDTLDETLPLNGPMWANVISAFKLHHIFKIGGDQTKGFVQFGPEHEIPNKKVCVMTPAEATKAGITPINLIDYIPDQECTYIFGPDNTQRGWHENFDEPDTDYITITTPSNTEMYSFTAAIMVLWHHSVTAK